jgi:hypothetical protein
VKSVKSVVKIPSFPASQLALISFFGHWQLLSERDNLRAW